MIATEPLLTVTGLVKKYPVRLHGRRAHLTAVDGVDLAVRQGETVALVGESGSGKSTIARCIARLVEPTAGELTLGSTDIRRVRPRSMWRLYGDLQMVFQDPLTFLNPRMTAGQAIDEPLKLHSNRSAAERARETERLFAEVGLGLELTNRYPRQLSGGQRQRVGIARALAVAPKIVLLDEPTSALDVSVRGQILDVLARVQRERNVGYLLISHDLDAVRHLADRIVVLYLGSVVEEGRVDEIFDSPRHPYTRALLSSRMAADYGRTTHRIRLAGEIPSPVDLPRGCRLASRCPIAQPECHDARPLAVAVSTTHTVACPIAVGTATGKEADLASPGGI